MVNSEVNSEVNLRSQESNPNLAFTANMNFWLSTIHKHTIPSVELTVSKKSIANTAVRTLETQIRNPMLSRRATLL